MAGLAPPPHRDRASVPAVDRWPWLPPVPDLRRTAATAPAIAPAPAAQPSLPFVPVPAPRRASPVPRPRITHDVPAPAPAPAPLIAPEAQALAAEVGPIRSTSKLPQITLSFWVIKMAATTLGETGGDQISEAMHVGYVVTFVLFMAVFLAAVTAQVRAGRLVPALFWTVIVATSAAGTEMADFIFETVGIGFVSGVMALLAPIAVIFLIARSTGGSFSVTDITTRRDEALYWTTILTTNTVGTGIGDGLTAGLGIAGGTLVASTAMAVIVWLYFRSSISRVALFWAAFIMTRPLGAAGGDMLWQPHEVGGLGLGRVTVSLVLLAFIAVMVAATSGRDGTGRPA